MRTMHWTYRLAITASDPYYRTVQAIVPYHRRFYVTLRRIAIINTFNPKPMIHYLKVTVNFKDRQTKKNKKA